MPVQLSKSNNGIRMLGEEASASEIHTVAPLVSAPVPSDKSLFLAPELVVVRHDLTSEYVDRRSSTFEYVDRRNTTFE